MIDWEFIRSLEGKLVTVGYVPRTKSGKVIGRSGVTIASGFDIGQRSETELYLLPLETTLRVRLYPYAEKRGELAIEYLKNHPLVISDVDAKKIDRVLKLEIADRFETIYKIVIGHDFKKVVARAQTVLLSLAYNFGPSYIQTMPITRSKILECLYSGVMGNAEQRWEVLSDWLRHFPSKNLELKKRRTREADYLDGKIPVTPTILSVT